MNISITARKFKAHETLKEFITEEVSKIDKFYDNILDIDVILSYQANKDTTKTSEIIVKVPGQILTASDVSDDYKKSTVLAVEKIHRQLEKLKTKSKTY
ncbi:MAG: ribosome-associated translation inhibitor RaiA [Ignavibacteriaceae bacterium]|jgi:putative sigma-54 modulation protein